MGTDEKKWSDERIEVALAKLLRYGVLLAAVTVLFGGLLYLIRRGDNPVELKDFHGEPAAYSSPVAIVRDSFDLRGRSLIQLGLLMLIATPVARVLFSVFAFARQRDFLYVGMTIVVLAVLMYSLFFGA
jgi:uncharacterized membrane protein